MEDAWTQMQVDRLPPGWEARIEPKTGKSYFINYFTRNASLDDPRLKLLTKQMERLPLQDEVRSGGPRAVPLMGASAINQQQHLNNSNNNMGGANHNTGGHQCPALVTPESVARIRAMFPTVPDTHIRTLLIKYHGREAVVVSALQVEKHPVATPGPFSQPPPPQPITTTRQPQSNVVPILSSLQRSQLARRTQPKPHSPKMKLRYLKSVFPVVEETILLDTLVNSDNNVTFATQRLMTMGFDKRDTPPPPTRICLNKKTPSEIADSKQKQQIQLSKNNKNTTPEEKQTIKARLCSKYPQVPERVVSLALDSADYNEQTAQTILEMMSEEKSNAKKDVDSDERECSQVIKEEANVKTEAVPTPPVAPLVKTKEPTKTKSERREAKQEKQNLEIHFESPYLIKAQGPNKTLPNGPDDSLLLEDYVTWMGAQRGLAKGPDRRLVCGPNPALRKGPQVQTKLDCDNSNKLKWCSALCENMNWK